MAKQMQQMVLQGQLQPPRVDDSRLIMASDYSGSDASSLFETYSFVVCDVSSVLGWLNARRDIRFGLGQRVMGFKGLNDHCRCRALPGFLEAANALRGLVVTVAVDKNVSVLFDDEVDFAWTERAFGSLPWKPTVYQRVVRLAFLGRFLLSLFPRAEKALWVSDVDEVAQNALQRRAFEAIARTVGRLFPAEALSLDFHTTASDDGSFEFEDICSIPDLLAGAVAEVLTSQKIAGTIGSPIVVRFAKTVTAKSRQIVEWLSTDSGLQRATCSIRQDSSGKTRVGWVFFAADIAPGSLLLTPRTHFELLHRRRREFLSK